MESKFRTPTRDQARPRRTTSLPGAPTAATYLAGVIAIAGLLAAMSGTDEI